MRAIATQAQQVQARRQGPRAPADRRRARGRRRRGPGPEPAGAARRVAGLLHRDHDGDVRQAQGLGHRRAARSTATTSPPSAAAVTQLRAVMRMPAPPQRRAGRAPAGDRREVPRAPHARGRGRLRRAGPARLSSLRESLAAGCWRPSRRSRWTSTAARTPPCSPRCTWTPRATLHAVFTRRRDDLRRHPGEISFPGGRRDPGETLLDTALREAARGDRPAAGARSTCSARCEPTPDLRHQLRDLSLRRADRARPRVGAAARPRSPRCSSCRSPTLARGLRGAAAGAQGRSRSARRPTRSTATSSGARPAGSCRTCSRASTALDAEQRSTAARAAASHAAWSAGSASSTSSGICHVSAAASRDLLSPCGSAPS